MPKGNDQRTLAVITACSSDPAPVNTVALAAVVILPALSSMSTEMLPDREAQRGFVRSAHTGQPALVLLQHWRAAHATH